MEVFHLFMPNVGQYYDYIDPIFINTDYRMKLFIFNYVIFIILEYVSSILSHCFLNQIHCN